MSRQKFRVNYATTLPAVAELTELTGKNLNFAQILNAASLRGKPHGTLSGTPRKIAGLLGWDKQTVEGLYRRMLEQPDGGNPALRALPAEREGEVKFYSEAVANSKQEMEEKAERREAKNAERREERQAAKTARAAAGASGAENADEAAAGAPEAPQPESETFKAWFEAYPAERRKNRAEAWKIWHENNFDACPHLAACFAECVAEKNAEIVYNADKLLREICEAVRDGGERAEKYSKWIGRRRGDLEKCRDGFQSTVNDTGDASSKQEVERLTRELEALPRLPRSLPFPPPASAS